MSKQTGESGELRVGELSEVGGWTGILRKYLRKLLLSEHFILILTIAYFVIMAPIIPDLIKISNLGNILSNFWPLLAVAIGQTFVLIVAGIDLSQTSIMATTSVIGGLIMTEQLNPILFQKSPLWGTGVTESGGLLAGSPWAIPVAVGLMLGVGTLIGLINGVSVAKLKMPPFMVTLVSMMFFSAFAIYLTKSENISNLPGTYDILGDASFQFSYLPYPLLISGGLAVLAHYVLNHTILGHWFYAIGQNVKTAKISGVPTGRVTILAYVFSGFCAAVASVLFSARLGGGRPTLGEGMLLEIIGAVVIGGTSLYGGKGRILWTVYGVLFFVLLSNTLSLLNLSFYTIDMVKGSFIVLAAFIDVTRTKILARET